MYRQLTIALVSVLSLALFPLAGRAQPPTPLVPGDAFRVAYSRDLIGDPVTIWYTQPTCDGLGIAGNELSPALITRGTTYGAAPRLLMRFNPPRAVATCNPYRMLSNLAADTGFIYFIDNQGPAGHWALQRRSRLGNEGDPSTFLADLGASLTGAEINAAYPNVIMSILHRQGATDIIVEHFKETGALVNGDVEQGPANTIRDFQFDGKFFYWINGSALRSDDTTNGVKRTVIASGVSTYHPHGFTTGQCGPDGCESDIAFINYGKGNQILLIDAIGGGDFPPQYTSVAPNATIQSIIRDNHDNLYFFERRPAVPGGVFDREDRLFRNRTLIFGPVNNGGPGFDALDTDLTNLYFHDRTKNSLLKLANRSAGIPVFDLQGTGIEVTQGIQNPGNDATLIEGKRTMVRFYVKSGDAKVAAGVTAYLDVFNTEKYLGRLQPVNRTVGKLVTVRPSPLRMNVDDSFLFEVPIDWTGSTALTFTGVVNPLAGKVEDNFGNNFASSPLLVFTRSPRMLLEVVTFRYNRGGKLVFGSDLDDVNSVRWLRNLYPIMSSTAGGINQPGPGLRVRYSSVLDNALENRVNQTDDVCNAKMCKVVPGEAPKCCDAGQSDNDCRDRLFEEKGMFVDNRDLCAADYVIQQLQAMRSAGTIPKDRYIYGSIAWGAAPNTLFTRGFAPGGGPISAGPMKDPSPEQNYMAHEVGHTLGRGHPTSGAAPVCSGQSAGDDGYPYFQARIGGQLNSGGPFGGGGKDVSDEVAHARVDLGDFTNSAVRIVGAKTAGDIMSYCAPYGISSYNFERIFTQLSFFPLENAVLAAGAPGARAANMPGDWLLAFGSFPRVSGAGAFGVVRRLDSVADVPTLVDGGYMLELRGADDAVLASHAFTPRTNAETAHDLGFELVVPFEEGTRTLRVVERATSRVVATRAVSAGRPTLAAVELASATGPVTATGTGGPVTGAVTVAWTASDPDGDPLTFDLFYTHDAGATWQPIGLSMQGASVAVDTATLAGGTGQFRVEASDGAQNARAESAPFQIADKAPTVVIANPSDGFRVQWGQLVTFMGDVRDPQEQSFPAANLVWSSASRILGKGAGISVGDLEVGSNVVTLTATNAAGLTTTAAVTVVVGDVLTLPGPLLASTPSSVSWSIDGNESAVQTSSLAVSNVGGENELNFVATSNQPWLTVNGASSASLAAPATLTLSANPAELADLSATVAELRLTNTRDPQDVVIVPVTILKGNLVSGEPAPEETTCIVEEGETLATIAKRMYGDANQWRKIFNANRDQLTDPNVIAPGQKLRLPF